MSSYLLNRPVSVYADHALSTERPKSKDGETVVYRLKDWPSGEEFMALMPSRYLRNTGTSHVDTPFRHCFKDCECCFIVALHITCLRSDQA